MLDQYVQASDIEEALAEPVPEVDWEQPPSFEELLEEDAARVDTAGAVSGDPFAADSGFGGCSASVAAKQSRGGWWMALVALLGLGRRRRR